MKSRRHPGLAAGDRSLTRHQANRFGSHPAATRTNHSGPAKTTQRSRRPAARWCSRAAATSRT